ncbi:MAG: hypothetical protein BKP49_03035 [Treponema sp. CETP13]|nr:MAG: hypothetical protein BKP49_03035 [Treponema sp. CETP13]
MKQLKTLLSVINVSMLFIATSCATFRDYSNVENQIAMGDYENASATLVAEKNELYSKQDAVLYHLDLGLLSHYANDWYTSNENLESAELAIEEYSAKSISQAITSSLVNDNTKDYAGDDYEDLYTNLFKSLNYVHLGEYDEALVEIRRFDNKVKLLSEKYGEAITKAKKSALSYDVASTGEFSGKVNFHDSAFSRYLSMILYRDSGDVDNARVDAKYLDDAFLTQKQIYTFPKPQSITHELEEVPAGFVRVNFLSNSGLAPVKEALSYEVYSEDTLLKFQIPVMKKRPDEVAAVKVALSDSEGNPLETIELEKLESIENIAMDTFSQKQSLIYLKTFVRAAAKAITAQAVNKEAENSEFASLINIVTKVSIAASEQADLRTSHFFPANVWCGGITVPEGNYSIVVSYLDVLGSVVAIKNYNVSAKAGQPNIVESICVK